MVACVLSSMCDVFVSVVWPSFSARSAIDCFLLSIVLLRPGIRISGNCMSAAFASNEMWSTILGTTGFVAGTNRWTVRIDRSVTAYIFIGVATKDADLCNFLGSDQHGWGFIGDRALYHQRSKISLYGERRFAQGDQIGVTLVRFF